MRRTFTVREFARLPLTLDTNDACAPADAAGTDKKTQFTAALRAVSDRRVRMPDDAEDDDVIDPYRRSQETH